MCVLSFYSCFTELSSRIVTQDEAIGNRSSDELYFPNLVWLIRDFDLVTKDEHGNPITPTEYIRTQILTPSEESEASSSEDVARAILSLFPLVECRTIPHPGSDPAAATIQLEGLADFNEKVEEVGDFLLSTIERKRGFRDGDNVNGPTLAALTEEYVRALNSPDCSVNLESSWIKARITALLHKLVSEYEQDMEKAVESVLPMPEGHLNDALPPVKATASAQQELGVSEDEQQQQELPGLDDPASTQGAARSAIGVSLAPEFVEALLRKFVSEFEQDMKKAVESVLPMPEGDLNDALAPVKATASVQQELEESKDEQQQQEQPGLDEPGLDDPASTQEAANKTETSEKSLQCITNECPLPKEDSEVNEQQPLLPFPLIGGGIRIDLNTPSSVQGEDTEYQHRIEVRSTTSINLSPEYAIPVEVVVTVPVIVPPPPPLRNEDNTPKTLMSIHCSILKQKLEILQRELDSLMPVPNSNTKERRDEVIDNIMQQIVECKISGEVDSGMLKKFVRNNRIKSRENCEKIFNKVFQPLKDNFSRRNEMIGVTNYYRAAVGPAKSLVFLKKKRELVKYASTLIPSKPENIRVIGRGHNRIKIRWDEPLIRPMAAKRYCVQKRKENDSAWLEVTLTSGFSALITGLESDTKYRFRVHGIAGKSTSESAEVKTETKYQPAVQKTLSVASGLAGGTIGAPVVAAHAGVIVAQYGWKNRDMGAVCLGVTSVAISPLALLSGYITGPHVARMTALKLGEEGDLSYPNPDSKSETDSDPPTDITDSDIDFYN